MSIDERTYLAAHAPHENDPWFEPVFDEPEPQCPPGAEECPACANWHSRPCMKTPGCLARQEWIKAHDAWVKRQIKATTSQWPWAWADAVMAGRLAVKPTIKVCENNHRKVWYEGDSCPACDHFWAGIIHAQQALNTP